MRNLPRKYVHQAALDAQAEGIRRIYADRRRREMRRQRIRWIIEWLIVAICVAGGLAWVVRKNAPPAHGPVVMPTQEDGYVPHE